MSQSQPLTGKLSIHVSPGEFHQYYVNKPHDIPNYNSELKKVDLNDGQWGQQGHKATWTYSLGGETQISKGVMEEIDNVNYKTTLKVLEGSLLKNYKSFSVELQATPDGTGSLLKWTLKYEKLNENVPEPNDVLQAMINSTKELVAKRFPPK